MAIRARQLYMCTEINMMCMYMYIDLHLSGRKWRVRGAAFARGRAKDRYRTTAAAQRRLPEMI